MLYDERRIYINGESYLAAGRDARLMQRLADERRLDAATLRRASRAALELLALWKEAGWLHDEFE
jgi:50S ribosomal protein L16 3-hydroxylase